MKIISSHNKILNLRHFFKGVCRNTAITSKSIIDFRFGRCRSSLVCWESVEKKHWVKAKQSKHNGVERAEKKGGKKGECRPSTGERQ